MLITELLNVKIRDLSWLKDALRTAIQLEFFTIPPYLCALWSIKAEGKGKEVSKRIRSIVKEEMLHMGLACNMLVALDPLNDPNAAFPPLSDRSFAPQYPSPLPGIGDGSLIVGLAPVSKDLVEHVFMRIEYPQSGPVPSFQRLSQTIGGFYQEISKTFEKLNPTIYIERQIEDPTIDLNKLTTLDDVKQAVGMIVGQGEGKPGTMGTPCADQGSAPKCKLAHYYQFKEIAEGKKLEWDGKKLVEGKPNSVPFPDQIFEMAVIPCGGHPYDANKVPQLRQFDEKYTEMLRKLQAAWQQGSKKLYDEAVNIMRDLGAGGLVTLAKALMGHPNGSGKSGNYGPNFRLV